MSGSDFRSLFFETPKKAWQSGLGPTGGFWRAQAGSLADDAVDDDRFGAFQQAWKGGASITHLFGDNPFDLGGSVGAGNSANRRADVAKVETFLGRTGHYEPLKDGPSGYVNTRLDEAIRGFQKDNGLDIDGILKPGGYTIATLASAVSEGENASGTVHVQAYEQGRDGRTVHVSDYERRRPGTGSGAAGGRGEPASLLRFADSDAVKADAAPEKQPRKSSLNVDRFVNTLDKNAEAKSQGYCARYVRRALQAGGFDASGSPVPAKDWGPTLEKNGFEAMDKNGYVPQKGDVVVIQPYEGGNENGHMAAYDGKQWVSDFKQSGFWPGHGYRSAQPPYKIYRKTP